MYIVDSTLLKIYNALIFLRLSLISFLQGKEKLINPFMRVDKKTVRDHSGNTTSNIDTMKFLRTEKDSFKPT